MEEGIEPPDTAEPRAERDLRRWQRRFLQQFLCEKQALGLHDFDRRHSEGLHNQAPQLSGTEAGAERELLHRVTLDSPLANGGEKSSFEGNYGHRGSQFRPTAQAGSKTS